MIGVGAKSASLAQIALTAGVRGGGAFFIFAFNLLIARALHPEQAGIFLWAFSGVMILVQLSIIGLHDVALRFIASSTADGDWPKANAISSTITRWVLYGTIATTTAIITASMLIPSKHWVAMPELKLTIITMAPAIPFWGLAYVYAYKLQAVGKPLKSTLVLTALPYLLSCTFILTFNTESAIAAGAAYAAACFCTCLISYYWWTNAKTHTPKTSINTKFLRQMAFPMWAVAMMSVIMNWGGQFASKIWLTEIEVAGFALALRTSVIISFILVTLNLLIAPKIASLHNQGKSEELQSLIIDSCRVVYIIAVPIVILLAIFPDHVMGIFGERFRQYAGVLIILAIGQVINIMTGPASYVLTMTGHEKDVMFSYAITVSLFIILVFTLTPLHGIHGLALATSASISIHNLGTFFLAAKRTGIWVLPFVPKKNFPT